MGTTGGLNIAPETTDDITGETEEASTVTLSEVTFGEGTQSTEEGKDAPQTKRSDITKITTLPKEDSTDELTTRAENTDDVTSSQSAVPVTETPPANKDASTHEESLNTEKALVDIDSPSTEEITVTDETSQTTVTPTEELPAKTEPETTEDALSGGVITTLRAIPATAEASSSEETQSAEHDVDIEQSTTTE